MKKIIKFIKDRDIFIIFALFVGILTYMVGLRDRAEAEAFENEQNKIKENLIEKVDDQFMKIIDLAEKQLNNEILPKHIRYNNEDLYFDGVSYCDKQGNNDLLDILAMENSAITHLYDEVEIIEEDKKIDNSMPKHLSNEFIQQIDKCITHQDIKCIAHKVNEVINYLQHISK